MIGLLILAVWLAFPLIAALLTLHEAEKRKHQSDLSHLQEAARILDGEVADSPGTAVPFVRFQLAGVRCYFLWHEDRTVFEAKAVTDLWIEAGSRAAVWSTAPGKIEIHDENFRIRTDDAWAAGQWLANGGREILSSLDGVFRIQISPGLTSLHLERHVPAHGLKECRSKFERVLKSIAAKRGPGIEFVKESFEQGDGVCQVCSSSLAGPFVRCRDCKTPHHRDCWTYLGRCSTFGCRGKDTE